MPGRLSTIDRSTEETEVRVRDRLTIEESAQRAVSPGGIRELLERDDG